MNRVKIAHSLLIINFCMVMTCCETPNRPSIIGNDGQPYGRVDSQFQYRWWNYYQRGLSFADGALTYMNDPINHGKALDIFQLAEHDLSDALSLRTIDQLRARTYGMHFIDYFPHRELGIIYYHKALIYKQNKQIPHAIDCITQALTEIEISLYQSPLSYYFNQNMLPPYYAKSEKAIVYLQKSRSLFNQLTSPDTPLDFYAWPIKQTIQSDQKESIDIWRIHPVHMTYLDTILLEGRIKHDQDIHSIQLLVNDQSTVVPVSGNDIHFFKLVPLSTGKNTIILTCTDARNHPFSAQRIVQKQVMHFPDKGNQLRVTIKPFEKKNTPLVTQLERYLEKNMTEKPRFIVLSSKDHLPADCHLNGRTYVRKYSLEIAVELHDIESSTIKSITAFIEGMNDQPETLLNTITANINANLADIWPILSGTCEELIDDKVMVRMTYFNQAMKGMKVLFFDKEISSESLLITQPLYSGTIEYILNGNVFVSWDTQQPFIKGMNVITR